MKYRDFLKLLNVVSSNGRTARCYCPAHDDANPSLTVTEGDDGRILVHCHAGCTTEEILNAVGLTEKDLFDDDFSSKGKEPYAEDKFHDLSDEYWKSFKSDIPEKYRHRYDNIVKDGDPVSTLSFQLPREIDMPHDDNGKEYKDHLYVDEETGVATIKLNSWEEGVLREEEARDDFVCWIRNPSERGWGLTIAYEYNGEDKTFRPDFLIVRKDRTGDGYIVDILEPHRPNLDDNLGKAKGFAKYARKYTPCIGRLQLIRAAKDATGKDGFVRLDMSKSAVREKVLRLTTPEELNRLFETDGFFD